MTTVTILGCGYAAQKYLLRIATNVFKPDIFNVVDINRSRLREGEAVLRKNGYTGEIRTYKTDFTLQNDSHPAKDCDYAIISTLNPRKETHIPLAIAFGENNNPIFIEKPLSRTKDMLDKALEIKSRTQVNYVEIMNPAFRAAIEDMIGESFAPERGYHLRCMLDKCGKPVFHHDALHDVSEILFFLERIGKSDSPQVKVKSFDTVMPEQFANIILNFDRAGATYEIVSSLSSLEEKRYFAWLGDDTCYLVNTLARSWIKPFAIKFAQGESAFEYFSYGSLIKQENIEALINKFSGKKLEIKKFPSDPVTEMMKDLKENDSLVSPIEFATKIERISYAVYEEARVNNGAPVYHQINDSLLLKLEELK